MFIKKSKKFRVLHCPIVALYQPYLYVKGLRDLGYKTDYMVHHFKYFAWLGRDCDFDLDLDGTNGLQIETTRVIEFFVHAVRNYDIFHFHSGYGLLCPMYAIWSRLDELRYLKRLGKKIVMSWWGNCDVRTEEIETQYPYSPCHACEHNVKESCNSADKKVAVDKAFKYVDIHLSNNDIVESHKMVWMDNAIDCNEWRPFEYQEIPERFRLPRTDNLRIYHSFGNRGLRGDIKGTRHIINTVERLKTEGYKVELIFFDKVPNKDLKYFQTQADIVVDQLKGGWHGSTAVECLALGKPVITYIRPEVERTIPHEHPLINASIDTIYTVLKNLLEHKEKLKAIGEDSRRYALEYHHYTHIAKKLDALYENLYT